MKIKKKRLILIERPEMKLLLRDLALGPANIHDLSAVLGLGTWQVYRYLKAARAAGIIRITGWERAHGGRPVYGLITNSCQRRDVPRPERIGYAEAKRRWRLKKAQCEPARKSI